MIRLTPSEQEKVAALDRAMHNEFASVLTPAELETYDLRMSNTANNLRYNLAKFEPTEAEFRSLYRLQSAFDEQFNGMPYSTQEQMKARSEANTRLQEQIAAALGPERYPEYQRASDYNFRQTSLLVERLGLPAETATALYTVQKETEDRRNEIYRSTTAETRDQMPQRLTALHADASKRVETLLGGKRSAIDAYGQYGGSWLTNLLPRPAPKK